MEGNQYSLRAPFQIRGHILANQFNWKTSKHICNAYVQVLGPFWYSMLVRVGSYTLFYSVPHTLLQVHCYTCVASYMGCSFLARCIAILVELAHTEDGIMAMLRLCFVWGFGSYMMSCFVHFSYFVCTVIAVCVDIAEEKLHMLWLFSL